MENITVCYIITAPSPNILFFLLNHHLILQGISLGKTSTKRLKH